ncbi:MAG: molybdopterin-dependent oxidoreductase [bacterium]|nr:molybdopterin-dependent oxidoreductase [bacterium]
MRHGYRWRDGDIDIIRSVCWSPPGCHGGCGVLLKVQDRQLIGVRGDPENRFNAGRLCPRGKCIVEAVYHPQRLLHPLIRDGQRGENHWRRTSFAEAADLIAGKFLKIKRSFGAESIIFCKGTALDVGAWLPRLAYAFGSPNYFGFGPGNGNACYRPRVALSTVVMGSLPLPDLGQFETPAQQYRRPGCILVWGANPINSNPDGLHGSWVLDRLKDGTGLVVVDPQKTGIAEQAQHWLRLLPGTDGALALGLIRELFHSNLIDEVFCRDWVLGLQELRLAAEPYNPERTAAQTGVAPADVIKAARFLGHSNPLALVWGVAVDMNPGCLGTIHGLLALAALTGSIEVPGGMVLQSDPFNVRRRGDSATNFSEVITRRIGADRYPLIEIGNPYGQPDILLDQMESNQPYPIKAAWLQGTGIVPSSFADPERVLRLFDQLEFIVTIDTFLTPTAVALADVILPAAMYPEKDSLFVHFSQLGAINKAVEPQGECQADAEIVLQLGRRIAPQHFPWINAREWIEDRLRPSGLTFAELQQRGSLVAPLTYQKHERGMLRPDGKPGFATLSGKIELDSSLLRELGLMSTAHYHDCKSEYRQQYGIKDFPYLLTSGTRRPYYFGAEHRNIPSLRRRQPEPWVEMNHDTAIQAGIENDDLVRIFSPFGSCTMKARISERFPAGVVHCDSGWWYPEQEAAKPELFGFRRSNVNALLPSGLQGPGGFGYPFRCFVCNVQKVDVVDNKDAN